MDLPTYTNIWRIEKRLYKLYDLRLPMPLPIVWIGVFVGVFVPWSLLLLLLHVPVAMPWHVLFLVPPGIVTWLSTRPVIEGKRLTELLESQLRYLGEPRAWYRLAPRSEPESITFSGRVWRATPAKVRVKAKQPRKARHSQRERVAAPAVREVRPAVAAAAAAAVQAPLAEPTTWGAPRRGAAPALGTSKAHATDSPVRPASPDRRVRRPAEDHPPTADRPARRTRRSDPDSPVRQAPPTTASPADPAPASRRKPFSLPQLEPTPASHDEPVTPAPQSAPDTASRSKPFSLPQLEPTPISHDEPVTPAPQSAPDTASRAEPGHTSQTEPGTASQAEAVTAAGSASFQTEEVTASRAKAGSASQAEPGSASQVEAGSASQVEAARASQGEAGAASVPAARRSVERPAVQETPAVPEGAEGKGPERGRKGERTGKPIDTEALRRLRRLAASADAPEAETEASSREEEAARLQHRKGQPPRQSATPDARPVWPILRPDAKPISRPSGSDEPTRTSRTGEAANPLEATPTAHDEARTGQPRGDGTQGQAARVETENKDARPGTHEDAEPRAGTGADSRAGTGAETPGGTSTETRADSRAGTGAETQPRAAAPQRSGQRSGEAPPLVLEGGSGQVPGPRPGAEREARVRRVESVVGRDSGGWRRIAQVVVGGSGVRSDGSEIDEARARAVFSGSRRIVILGCTGGAGQSTTTLMLGHTLARYRDDRVLAVDASAGAHTLSNRVKPESPETLTSLLSGLDRVSGYLTMRGYTTRTPSGLEVIGSDSDAEAERRLADRSLFSDDRLGQAVHLIDRYYKLAVVDPAPALAARVLPYADQLVLVVPASEEAAEAVAMTYEWLDGHGCADLRRRAVMVVNGVSRRSMSDVEQAESVASGRCRAIVRVPWEDDLAPGGADVVEPGQLRAAGRRAYLALAGVVVAGFAAQTAGRSSRASEEELASDPPGTRIGER
ncbi:conjugal transfer protein [Nonomuraea sediminis]|uniref:conjugal transfer protein n=1 Tax=Nonomuraea sediminis TaxID=2835864 RepID=UPI001BDBE6F4|nr:conjugal transfer protein [Nonomuraea sediminis]